MTRRAAAAPASDADARWMARCLELAGQGRGRTAPNPIVGCVIVDRRGRVRGLFDPYLIKALEAFEHDDVLVPQWQYYDALRCAPLMLMRTQLTEQLRRETFEEMVRRRRDAEGYVIEGQGSPALLNTAEDVAPIAEFVRRIVKQRGKVAA